MYPNTPEAIASLMWAGKTEELHEQFPCKCCCDEHTTKDCPARCWGGLGPGEED